MVRYDKMITLSKQKIARGGVDFDSQSSKVLAAYEEFEDAYNSFLTRGLISRGAVLLQETMTLGFLTNGENGCIPELSFADLNFDRNSCKIDFAGFKRILNVCTGHEDDTVVSTLIRTALVMFWQASVRVTTMIANSQIEESYKDENMFLNS